MVNVKVKVRVQHRFGVACIASILILKSFPHSGHKKKIGEREQKHDEAGRGGANRRMLACKPLNFEKCPLVLGVEFIYCPLVFGVENIC